VKIKPDELLFIWDPDANKKNSHHLPYDNKQDTVRSFEDYFDFIDQFENVPEKNKTDQHVDKKFSLY
jgi:hypothetical protein